MQSTARKNELPLDRMSLACEVTKKTRDELTSPPRDGANIHGLFMEGARYIVIVLTLKKLKILKFSRYFKSFHEFL